MDWALLGTSSSLSVSSPNSMISKELDSSFSASFALEVSSSSSEVSSSSFCPHESSESSSTRWSSVVMFTLYVGTSFIGDAPVPDVTISCVTLSFVSSSALKPSFVVDVGTSSATSFLMNSSAATRVSDEDGASYIDVVLFPWDDQQLDLHLSRREEGGCHEFIGFDQPIHLFEDFTDIPNDFLRRFY
ncbi:hypothetical protein TSUD_159650 [Trifolium subterraneum]|uniref:Uncharacterized protein n=1 Tax=Trifolium subterraneum TaxID=3900 RepID=A0A2Z6MFF2_TRISU|nr:hypothetical protein TSUD_159650 [Trifolium subterraneum]